MWLYVVISGGLRAAILLPGPTMLGIVWLVLLVRLMLMLPLLLLPFYPSSSSTRLLVMLLLPFLIPGHRRPGQLLSRHISKARPACLRTTRPRACPTASAVVHGRLPQCALVEGSLACSALETEGGGIKHFAFVNAWPGCCCRRRRRRLVAHIETGRSMARIIALGSPRKGPTIARVAWRLMSGPFGKLPRAEAGSQWIFWRQYVRVYEFFWFRTIAVQLIVIVFKWALEFGRPGMSGRWLRGRCQTGWLNHSIIRGHPFSTSFRKNGTAQQQQPPSATRAALTRTRNIGIIAHIDAVCQSSSFSLNTQLNVQIRAKQPPQSVCSTIAATPDE